MKVREIMSSPVISVPGSITLERLARLMLARNISGVPVVGPDGRLRGIVTESDFTAKRKPVPFSTLNLPSLFGRWLERGVEHAYQEARFITADQVMTEDVVTIGEEDGIDVALRRMCERHVHRLPVVRGGVPVGMVTRQDLLKLMLLNRDAGDAKVGDSRGTVPVPAAHGPWEA